MLVLYVGPEARSTELTKGTNSQREVGVRHDILHRCSAACLRGSFLGKALCIPLPMFSLLSGCIFPVHLICADGSSKIPRRDLAPKNTVDESQTGSFLHAVDWRAGTDDGPGPKPLTERWVRCLIPFFCTLFFCLAPGTWHLALGTRREAPDRQLRLDITCFG